MSEIFRELLDVDGVISLEAWTDAVVGYRMVGRCGSCRKMLRPERPRKERRITWFSAECTGCGRQITSPNGRLRQPVEA